MPAMAVLVLVGLAGCSSPPPEKATGAQAMSAGTGTELRAALVSPVDSALSWKGTDPGAAGRVVEFATDPRGPYTILEYLPLTQRTYRHPDLIPETSFYYRLRPFYGVASQPIEVDLPEGGLSEKDQKNDHKWAPPRTVPGNHVATHSVRDVDSRAAAAPTGLRATVMHANGIKFTWTDHAADEQGYLLENRPSGSEGFRPVAVLDPDINSFGLITLENEKRAAYRIRAFRYGQQSNVVRLRTGQAPADRS